MVAFIYELEYVDKRKFVPVNEVPKIRTIATVINGVTWTDINRLYHRLTLKGCITNIRILKDGNYRIQYMSLPDGLKFDPFYKNGMYYRGRSVFDRDDT